MSDSFVTQCPHCQTRFKVNHAQLSVARGVVRCGACLQVFNAARQLLEQRNQELAGIEPAPDLVELQPATPVAPPLVVEVPAAPATPATPAAQPPLPHDNDQWLNELDLDDLDEELARLERRETLQAEAQGDRLRNSEPLLTAQRDTPQNEQGEWIGTLHNDDVSHLPEVHAEVINSREPELPEHPHDAPHDTRTEPSLASSPVAPDDDEPEPPSLTLHKPSRARGERLSARDDDDSQDDDEPYDRRHEPAIREKALMDLTDDPLQLDWQRPKARAGRNLLWSLLILLAAGGLAGQYIWYHFDHLARLDQYRPWFQQLCPTLGCKVPSKVDINQLKSSNLVVRSHPDFQGALVVDAIIYNRASFSQPFPLLELRFADTSGQLIASRRFKPGEYLSGEMAGKEDMPPQTPIHIALDILDPGAKAVNYSLNFRSPE